MQKMVKILSVDWDFSGYYDNETNEEIDELRIEHDTHGLAEGVVTEIEVEDPNDKDEIEDIISDWLTDTYGYFHNGYEYEAA